MTSTAVAPAASSTLPLAAGDVVQYNRDGRARLIAEQADGRWTAEFFAGAARFIGKTRTITATIAQRRELAPREVAPVADAEWATPPAELIAAGFLRPWVVAADDLPLYDVPAAEVTPATDDQISAAVDRGLAVGTLVAVDDAFLATLAAQIAEPAAAEVVAPKPARKPSARRQRYIATLQTENAECRNRAGEWVLVGAGTTAYAADNHVYDIKRGVVAMWAGFEARRRNTVEVWARYTG